MQEKQKSVLPEDILKTGVPHNYDVRIEHDPDDLWDESRMIINIGPTHPAMHGALRMMAKINGEIIEKSYCEFGYTHRAKEKLGENRTYHQFIVYTDRPNYCSALINNVAYAMSVERLMGVSVPERTIWIRMMCSEIARVADHLICIGISAVDLGAFSFFLYGFHQREEAYTLIEKLCGSRLTTSYTRIGGLMHDAPEGWEKEVKQWAQSTRKVIEEMDRLLTSNKIWVKRTEGVGVFDKKSCLEYSFTGPNARAAGIDVDLRRDQPYMFYKDIEFDVPVAQNGDCYDRYLVRLEEIKQSLAILIQCADRIKKGPVWSEDKRVRIPDKDVVHNTMEGLIHHFKFFMTGFQVPSGEAYTTVEGANGELGFYIVSKNAPMAHRMRIRGPSVYHYQGLDKMVRGQYLGDLVAALGSINIIAGEPTDKMDKVGMEKVLSENFYQKVKKIEGNYPQKQALLLPMLHFAQEECGWLPAETLDEIAGYIGIHPAVVREVASFYTMYNLKPCGKCQLKICTSVVCMLRGAYEILEHCEHKLNIHHGETTEDKLFTVHEEECIGACGTAPAMMSNDDYHENLSIEKVDALIDKIKKEESAKNRGAACN